MNSDSNINTSTNTFGKYVICKYLHPYFVFVLKIQILTCQAWNDIIKHCNVTKNALNLTISLKTNFSFVDFSKKIMVQNFCLNLTEKEEGRKSNRAMKEESWL